MAIHGYLLRSGSGPRWRRAVAGCWSGIPDRPIPPSSPSIWWTSRARELHAEGQCLNGLGLFLNPNLYSVNCLTEWTFDGITAFGEDHDNWSANGIRQFLRSRSARRPSDNPIADRSEVSAEEVHSP